MNLIEKYLLFTTCLLGFAVNMNVGFHKKILGTLKNGNMSDGFLHEDHCLLE